MPRQLLISIVSGLALAAGALAAGPPSPSVSASPVASSQHVYSTWSSLLEVDKAASIWLIRRHIDPEARFRFLPRGERIREGTSFEVPFADLTRAPNESLFGTLLATRVEEPDAALLYIARIVHDAEVNVWAEKQVAETEGVERIVAGLAAGGPSEDALVERVLVVFDALALGLKERLR